MRDQPSNLRSSGSMRDQPSNLFSRGSIFYRRPFNLQGMAEKHGFIFLGTKIIIKTLADWLYLDESVLSGYPHLSRAMVRLEEERTKGSWGWCCGSWTRWTSSLRWAAATSPSQPHRLTSLLLSWLFFSYIVCFFYQWHIFGILEKMGTSINLFPGFGSSCFIAYFMMLDNCLHIVP